MIAPLPPQPWLSQPADQANTKPDPRSDADGFADVLAAAGAAQPRAPRLQGPPQTLKHGPAIVRVANPVEPAKPAEAVSQAPAGIPTEAPVQAGLTDPAGEIAATRPDQPQLAARVFNQDGFFGTCVDAASTDPVGASAAASVMPGAAAAQTPFQPDPPIAELPPAAAGAMPASAGAAGGAARPAVLPGVSRARPGPLAALGAPRAAAFEAEAEAEPAKPSARRFSLREPAARTAVQVAMRELEQGIHVAARAEGLDAAERVRLHDEIAALLARHGLSARSIRISAPLRGSPSQERLK